MSGARLGQSHPSCSVDHRLSDNAQLMSQWCAPVLVHEVWPCECPVHSAKINHHATVVAGSFPINDVGPSRDFVHGQVGADSDVVNELANGLISRTRNMQGT